MTSFALAVDGAAKGNPGAAGIGIVLYDENGEIVRQIGEYIGEATNNVAEYTALIRGLEEALSLGAASLRINTDSELLARQIAGVYKVKSPHLAELYLKAKSLLAKIPDAKIQHVPREQNATADKLASEAASKRANVGRKPKAKRPARKSDHQPKSSAPDTNKAEASGDDQLSLL
jgi:ribonuclease HI